VVASYDHDHAGQVVQCFGAGKHVFVEKPLCRTRAELAAIQGAWRPDLHMSANLVLRAAPLYRELGVRVRQGGLGQVYALDGEYLYGRLHKITEGWRAMVPEYSVLQGGGIHMLDLLVDLAGERPNAVTATGNRISTQGSAFQGPADFAVATFEFPSGQVGRLVANFGSVLPHQHALRVYGTTGTFLYDDAGARLHTSRDPEAVLTSLTASPFPSSKGALVPELIGAIQGGADPLPAFRREVTLMSACLAADDALRTRERVEIHYESVD
jgi:predicted dehydrogenase